MRRGNFLSLLRDDELSRGASAGCALYEDLRAGLLLFCFGGGGGIMPSKLSLQVAGGVGGSACLGGLVGMGGTAGMGGIVRDM